MLRKVFISSGRNDSRYQARLIYAALTEVLPDENVFLDINSIPIGSDFRKGLISRVEQCDIVLALIGPDWINSTDPRTGHQRLQDPDDFVRIAIAAALEREMLVVPVLLDGAAMPDAEMLPPNLTELVYRNAELVDFETFNDNVATLIRKLELGARPEELFRAASSGSLAQVQALLAGGADANSKDSDGQTPLHSATDCDNSNIIQALLTGGADANAKDKHGQTALHSAVYCDNTNIVQVLLTGGADANAKDSDGQTALHLAADFADPDIDKNKPDIVRALLGGGADVNAKDAHGRTALHFAVLHESTDIVEALLAGGADVNVEDEFGETALQFAVECDNTNILQALLTGDAGAATTGRRFWNSKGGYYDRSPKNTLAILGTLGVIAAVVYLLLG